MVGFFSMKFARGVAASNITVTAAIQAYAGDLADAAAAKLIAKYTAELDQTRIGWSNATGPTDENSYLRIDGPSVWIEFATQNGVVYNTQVHYHTVYRDHTRDYGGEFSF